MSKNKDNISLYEQQEERIRLQSDAFITLLTRRGILGDHQIDDEKIRTARQEKQKVISFRTQVTGFKLAEPEDGWPGCAVKCGFAA